jgi:hypothetical protein
MAYGSAALIALALLVVPSTVCTEGTEARVHYSAAEYLKNFA